jgi:hypothetical protein
LFGFSCEFGGVLLAVPAVGSPARASRQSPGNPAFGRERGVTLLPISFYDLHRLNLDRGGAFRPRSFRALQTVIVADVENAFRVFGAFDQHAFAIVLPVVDAHHAPAVVLAPGDIGAAIHPGDQFPFFDNYWVHLIPL